MIIVIKFLLWRAALVIAVIAASATSRTVIPIHMDIIDEPPHQNTIQECHALMPEDTWPDNCDA